MYGCPIIRECRQERMNHDHHWFVPLTSVVVCSVFFLETYESVPLSLSQRTCDSVEILWSTSALPPPSRPLFHCHLVESTYSSLSLFGVPCRIHTSSNTLSSAIQVGVISLQPSGRPLCCCFKKVRQCAPLENP